MWVIGEGGQPEVGRLYFMLGLLRVVISSRSASHKPKHA